MARSTASRTSSSVSLQSAPSSSSSTHSSSVSVSTIVAGRAGARRAVRVGGSRRRVHRGAGAHRQRGDARTSADGAATTSLPVISTAAGSVTTRVSGTAIAYVGCASTVISIVCGRPAGRASADRSPASAAASSAGRTTAFHPFGSSTSDVCDSTEPRISRAVAASTPAAPPSPATHASLIRLRRRTSELVRRPAAFGVSATPPNSRVHADGDGITANDAPVVVMFVASAAAGTVTDTTSARVMSYPEMKGTSIRTSNAETRVTIDWVAAREASAFWTTRFQPLTSSLLDVSPRTIATLRSEPASPTVSTHASPSSESVSWCVTPSSSMLRSVSFPKSVATLTEPTIGVMIIGWTS